MSDFVSAATKGKQDFGFRHTSDYWSDSSKRGKEAFVEIASAKATNPQSYSLLRKFLPDTVKSFEEIYDKLKRGGIKPNGRPKFQP
ncbi:MAG: hypothetical protein IKC74_01660 [Clostridia bacterium]|nr:hypothetical protein [Clostridia bacterium]